MAIPSDVHPLDSPPDPGSAVIGSSWTRRGVGLVLAAVLVAGFFGVMDLTRLDVARDEVAIATAVDVARAGVPADQVSNCFQGFCFEDDIGFAQRWWDFSTTYLRLVWPGLVLAFAVAGVLDGFAWRSGRGPAFGTWATMRLGARAERRGSSVLPTARSTRSAAAVAVGAVAAPALAMTLLLFSPRVWGTTLALAFGVAAANLLLLRSKDAVAAVEPDLTWAGVARDAALASWRFAYRLTPWFVAAAFAGGLATQYLTVDGVNAVAGGHLVGLTLAVLVGLLLDVPLMYGLPIAALALLVGADPVVVGVLMVSLAVVGPLLLRDMARESGFRVAALVVGILLVASAATFAGANAVIAATGGPTIAWDGEACSYSGPSRFGPGVYDFEVTNTTEDAGDGHTLAIVIGKLPANVTLDHFDATVAADPTADLPGWFTVAGTREFVFPGSTEPAEITFHDPGTYAAVCLDGGGFYVIFEFSMPQPMGWFDEFRNTFNGYVAEETFEVAG